MAARLVRGLGAQGFSQAVQVFVRLAEIPLFLGIWGTQLYGEWLMLAAIPSYLALGDGGFTSAANHDMAIRASGGDRDGALDVFRSTWVLVTLLSSALGLLAAGIVSVTPIDRWLGFEVMTSATAKVVALLLILHVVTGLQSGLLNGVFWCEGRYSTGMFLLAIMRLLEFSGMGAAVLLHAGPAAAALGFLGGRLAGVIALRMALRRTAPWLHYGFRGASLSEIRRLARPAFASLAFPLGNAFNIQGMRLIIGGVLGPAAVAVFAPLRTLSQLPMQPRSVISLLVEPEMGLAFGAANTRLFRELFRRSCQAALWIGIAAAVLVAVAAPGILEHWAQGQVRMDWGLFAPLLAAAAVNSLWFTAMMAAYATNRHERIAAVYSVGYGAGGLMLAYVGARTNGFLGVGVAILAAEVGMGTYVVPAAMRMSGESWPAWLHSLSTPPLFLVRSLKPAVRAARKGEGDNP